MTHVKRLRNNINTTTNTTFYIEKSPEVCLWEVVVRSARADRLLCHSKRRVIWNRPESCDTRFSCDRLLCNSKRRVIWNRPESCDTGFRWRWFITHTISLGSWWMFLTCVHVCVLSIPVQLGAVFCIYLLFLMKKTIYKPMWNTCYAWVISQFISHVGTNLHYQNKHYGRTVLSLNPDIIVVLKEVEVFSLWLSGNEPD